MWLASFPEASRGKAAEAMQLHKEAQRQLRALAADGCHTHAVVQIHECYSNGDDIVLNNAVLCFLRQQRPPYLCLADYVRPMAADAAPDHIGLFATCADADIEQRYAGEDDYRHLLCQTLADRLAEATAELLHLQVRKQIWGYAPDEHLSIAELHAEHFQGIRPAVGYPSLPDQSINFDLDRILDFASIGITLTQSGAMRPHAAVSGLMLSHPEARYFSIGPIGDDQLNDYARRRHMDLDKLRPFLNL